MAEKAIQDQSLKARRYEARYPETGCPEAQKEERIERIDHKEEVRDHRRTGRTRSVLIPALPASMEPDPDPKEASTV